MNERFEKIYEIAEREGWAVSHHYESETIVYFLFSKFSPLGKDFNVEVTVDDDKEDEDFVYENVCNAVYDFWEGYDVCDFCENYYEWLQEEYGDDADEHDTLESWLMYAGF